MRERSCVANGLVDGWDDGKVAVSEWKAEEVRLVLKLIFSFSVEDLLFVLCRHPSGSILVDCIIVALLIQHEPIDVKQTGIIGPDDFSALPPRLQLILKQLTLHFLAQEVLHERYEILVVKLDVAIRADANCYLHLLLKIAFVNLLRRRFLRL